MLVTARERAAALGLAHAEFQAADVSTLELPAGTLDAVLGRWSLIYVVDVPAALRRLRESLASGGRIAVAAWAPPDANPWITIPMAALARVMPMSAPDPNAPGLFHLSEDGALASALGAAGFRDTHQARVQLSHFARDPGEFWAMLSDMAGPLAPLLAGLGEPERTRMLREVNEGI